MYTITYLFNLFLNITCICCFPLSLKVWMSCIIRVVVTKCSFRQRGDGWYVIEFPNWSHLLPYIVWNSSGKCHSTETNRSSTMEYSLLHFLGSKVQHKFFTQNLEKNGFCFVNRRHTKTTKNNTKQKTNSHNKIYVTVWCQ